MNGTIYRIFNLINGKSYIGKTYSGFYVRLQQHIKDAIKFKTRPLYRAFNKYGIDNFSAEILGHFPEGVLEEEEINYIQHYNSYKKGYNATLGGDGSRHITVPIDSLVESYRITGNLTATGRLFNIDPTSCKRILVNHGEPIVEFDSKSNRRKMYSKKVFIPEVDLVFEDPYECAKFLMSCDIVPDTSNEISIGTCIRRVCTKERKHYLGIYFEYLIN